MVFIFLRVIVFTVSSFSKSNCHDVIANDEWSPVHPTSTGLSSLWAVLQLLHVYVSANSGHFEHIM